MIVPDSYLASGGSDCWRKMTTALCSLHWSLQSHRTSWLLLWYLVAEQSNLEAHVLIDHPQQEGSFCIMHLGSGSWEGRISCSQDLSWCKHEPMMLAAFLGLAGVVENKKYKGFFLICRLICKGTQTCKLSQTAEVAAVSLGSFMILWLIFLPFIYAHWTTSLMCPPSSSCE